MAKPLNAIGRLFEAADEANRLKFKAYILPHWRNWRVNYRYTDLDMVPSAILLGAVAYLGYEVPGFMPYQKPQTTYSNVEN